MVDHVFGGVLVSRVQCQQCGQVSSTFDSMNDLSVEVDNGYYGVVDSVHQALTSFVDAEVMSGDNAYYCDWCQRLVACCKLADCDEQDACMRIMLIHSMHSRHSMHSAHSTRNIHGTLSGAHHISVLHSLLIVTLA